MVDINSCDLLMKSNSIHNEIRRFCKKKQKIVAIKKNQQEKGYIVIQITASTKCDIVQSLRSTQCFYQRHVSRDTHIPPSFLMMHALGIF